MRAFALALLGLAVLACGPGSADLTDVRATVVFVPLEGGFFGVLADNGAQYEPRNLPADLKKEGQRIVFDAKYVNGASTSQWGRAIRLVAVRPQPGVPVTGAGTVVLVPLEGGFFALHGDDGARYEPRNLPSHLAEDGRRVVFTGRARPDVVGTILFGTVLDVVAAESGPDEPQSRVVRGDGTVVNDGIAGDDGVLYLVTNEPGGMPVPGTRVAFVAVRRPELAGTGGAPVVTVLHMELAS